MRTACCLDRSLLSHLNVVVRADEVVVLAALDRVKNGDDHGSFSLCTRLQSLRL
jgi:hypothetical protein